MSVPQRGLFGNIQSFIRGIVGGSQGGSRPSGGQQGRGQARSSCPNSGPNFGIYLVSWKNGCTSFTAREGDDYCRSNGMRAVSLDTPAKERELGQLLVREGQPYFWTGGKVNHQQRSVTWPSGRTTTRHNWSSGQPNNQEGNENCLAIIVKGRPGFNDVGCNHRKPVICQ